MKSEVSCELIFVHNPIEEHIWNEISMNSVNEMMLEIKFPMN